MKQISIGTVFVLLLLSSIVCNSNQKKGGELSAAVSKPVEENSSLDNSNALLINGSERVTFVTSDGVQIAGTLFLAGKDNSPAVVCLHQWMSDRSSFNSIAAKFVAKGINVLAIDMRGFGESTKKSTGEGVEPNRVAGADVEAAVLFLEKQKSVDKKKIGILGASYGASNAIQYASKNPDIRAVVLLSPGINYFNVLPTEEAVKGYGGRSLLCIASNEDLRSVEAVKKYQSILQNNIEVKFMDNLGHGTNMFRANMELENEVVAFFQKKL